MARNTLIDFLEYNDREDLVSKVAQILASDLSSSIQERKNTIFKKAELFIKENCC